MGDPLAASPFQSESRLEFRLRTKQLKFCWICGDEATSKHFGCVSCEACGAFFRRTIAQSKTYVCRYEKNCSLTSVPARRMCKYCRFKRCMASGMKAEEVKSGSNFSSSPEVKKDKISLTSDISTCLQLALILENSIVIAYQYPSLLLAYLENEEEKKLLDIAAINWRFVSNVQSRANEHFARQYLTLLGFNFLQQDQTLEVGKILDQCLSQCAELIKSRIRDDFEFAALCQLALIKVKSDLFNDKIYPFSEFQNPSIAKLKKCFEDKCSQSPGQNPNNCLNELIDLSSTIHEFRIAYRNRIIKFCQSLSFANQSNVFIGNNLTVE